MILALLHPEWNRSCAQCIAFDFDKEGKVRRLGNGEPAPRPVGVPTPCQSCPKPPKWAREQGKDWKELQALASDMTPANVQAYRFYRECKAVGHFPDDPIVRWAAGIIREVEDVAARRPVEAQTVALTHLITLLRVRLRLG